MTSDATPGYRKGAGWSSMAYSKVWSVVVSDRQDADAAALAPYRAT